jgi:hypothetical protein
MQTEFTRVYRLQSRHESETNDLTTENTSSAFRLPKLLVLERIFAALHWS